MRRKLTLCAVMALLLAMLLAAPALAAQANRVVRVEVTVSIKHGGTAVMEPLDGAPAPTASRLTLDNGEVGRFQMDFTEVGEYTYKITQVPGDKDLIYDTTPYTVKVYVVDSDGRLGAAVNVYNDTTGAKVDSRTEEQIWATEACEVNYVNKPKSPGEPDNPPGGGGGTTDPDGSSGGGKGTSTKVSTPKTGDSGLVERYFVQAMCAAFGLLTLSLIYLRNTLKLKSRVAAAARKRKSAQDRSLAHAGTGSVPRPDDVKPRGVGSANKQKR